MGDVVARDVLEGILTAHAPSAARAGGSMSQAESRPADSATARPHSDTLLAATVHPRHLAKTAARHEHGALRAPVRTHAAQSWHARRHARGGTRAVGAVAYTLTGPPS